jgi:hypothetical protein
VEVVMLAVISHGKRLIRVEKYPEAVGRKYLSRGTPALAKAEETQTVLIA